jgi:hypothetical protein
MGNLNLLGIAMTKLIQIFETAMAIVMMAVWGVYLFILWYLGSHRTLVPRPDIGLTFYLKSFNHVVYLSEQEGKIVMLVGYAAFSMTALCIVAAAISKLYSVSRADQ